MDESALTSQAIAELMRQDNNATLGPQERKINPLGRPNKRFLGRTLTSAVRHNNREIERTQASCQQKLQELDDSYERRKRNVFYTRDSRENDRSERKSRSRKKRKKRHKRSYSTNSSRSSSRESRSHSRSYKKERKKRRKKQKKSKHRRHSSSSSRNEKEPPTIATKNVTTPTDEYYMHSNNMALAVAMAYNQVLRAQAPQADQAPPPPPSSPTVDIIKELMSDDETADAKVQPDTLSIASSSDEVAEILTINVSSQEEESAESTTPDSETESNSGSCISLDNSEAEQEVDPANQNGSDIEIIESEPEQLGEEQQASTQQPVPEVASPLDLPTTVDLTKE